MSIFNENAGTQTDPTGGQSQATAPASGSVDQLLAGIKNEQGAQKYTSVEDAIKALQHSQEFIETLKREKQEIAAKLKAQEELEKLLAPKTQAPTPVVDSAAVLKPEDVVAVIESRERALTARKNIESVKAVFAQQFGAESTTELVKRVEQAGITKELADKMAAETPDALLKLLGVEKKEPTTGSVVKGAVNTEKLSGKPDTKPKFNPFNGGNNPALDKWRESAKRTNARLGL